MRPLRIALPKGRLLEPALALFAAAGCQVPDIAELKSRRLVFDKDQIEWIFVKDGDVPVYVEYGSADLGVAGLDQLREHDSDVLQPIELPFGRCRMMLIAASDVASFSSNAGTNIATKYPNITREFLRRRGLHFDIVPLQGSVELAAVLKLAPYIVDLVETGETIRVHGLRPLETIEEIAPRVIVNRSAYRIRNSEIRALLARVDATLQKEIEA